MYNEVCRIQNKEYEFLAAIHGADLGKEDESAPVQEGNLGKVPLFGDPAEYSALSKEEQDDLTNKMIGKHKSWATESKV